MKLKSWQDIRARKLSEEELRKLDYEIEHELIQMDLRSLCEALGLTEGKSS